MFQQSLPQNLSERDGLSANQSNAAEFETIRRAQLGDHRGFDRLYLLHCKRVYALCLRMLSSPSDAEDLTQEVFVQVFRKLGSFRAESQFSTWLHRVTVNVILMHFRRNKRISYSPEQQQIPLLSNAVSSPDSGSPALARSNSRIVDRINLQRALYDLPKPWRTVVLLHDVQGYKHTEIARMMHCSVSCSKGQLHRAHVRLRGVLKRAARQLACASV